jgi:hypothetical protein
MLPHFPWHYLDGSRSGWCSVLDYGRHWPLSIVVRSFVILLYFVKNFFSLEIFHNVTPLLVYLSTCGIRNAHIYLVRYWHTYVTVTTLLTYILHYGWYSPRLPVTITAKTSVNTKT